MNHGTATPAKVTVSVLSDRGCERQTNEDSGLCIHPAGELLVTRGVLTIIADGMGGHSGGEVASKMAVEEIAHLYYESQGDYRSALIQAFEETNRIIYERARRDDALRGMGTTCTALVLREENAYSVHVGDSRIYLIREGQTYLMTEDHSEVMERVRHGLLTVAEARCHADRNVILRCLGTRPFVEAVAWQEPLPVRGGDYFILCSDGLHDVVTDDEMRRIVDNTAEPSIACKELVALARSRGGPDNITVGVVTVNTARGAAELSRVETRDVGVLT